MSNQSTETITVTAEDGTVYEFEKPSFECELLKVVKDDCGTDYIIGYVLIEGMSEPIQWEAVNGKWFGTFSNTYDDSSEYNFNLTPIKKEWYEDEKMYRELTKDELKHMKVKL